MRSLMLCGTQVGFNGLSYLGKGDWSELMWFQGEELVTGQVDKRNVERKVKIGGGREKKWCKS